MSSEWSRSQNIVSLDSQRKWTSAVNAATVPPGLQSLLLHNEGLRMYRWQVTNAVGTLPIKIAGFWVHPATGLRLSPEFKARGEIRLMQRCRFFSGESISFRDDCGRLLAHRETTPGLVLVAWLALIFNATSAELNYTAGSESTHVSQSAPASTRVPTVQSAPSIDPQELQPRVRTNFDADWLFFKGDATGAEQAAFHDQGWQKVSLPHDWTISEPPEPNHSRLNGFLPKGIGWYRKHLTLAEPKNSRRTYLEFEGVYRDSILWINGQEVGRHRSGYTGVIYDVTPHMHQDGQPNVIALRVDARQREGWWYEGCGIYRHVWLIETEPVHVANWGTFVTTPEVSAVNAAVRVRTTVQNDTSAEQRCQLETHLLDAQGETVASTEGELTIPPESAKDFFQAMAIAHPHLWSPDTPYVYQARSQLRIGGRIVDVYDTPFGVRWFGFTPDRGFFLNGQHLQLRGVCIHHDFGGLGTALPDRANEKTVEVLKQMGCNFLRSSHNDAAPALLEACDRLGLLVWAETRYLGPTNAAGPPLRDLVRRSRNHPSIICWSLANTAGSKDGRETEFLKALNQIAHEEDPTRPTAFACEGNADANANGFALVTDLMGYNGGGMGIDDRDHRLYPQRKMLVSEFSSGRGARGVYEVKALAKVTTEISGDGRTNTLTGQYFSIYNLCRAHEAEWGHIAQRPWLGGGAMWSGIDYGGETCGWPIVTSQFGVLDRARFPNDAYYYYLQEWTATPLVHLFPHWTWPGKEGQTISVWCYSNAEAVELLLNGKSLGTKERRPLAHLEWKVPYEPGALVARASKSGQVVAVEEIKTAGPAAQIRLSADRQAIRADGRDLSFVTVSIHDAEGNVVPVASNEVAVEAEGSGRLIGLCSGDPASHENPKGHRMRAFNGRLLAIVQSDVHPGRISVRASSPRLTAGTLQLDASLR